MGVAVTLRAQTERERRQNENHYSLFRGSEEESLPELIEFGMPAFFQLAKAIIGQAEWLHRCQSAE
jgi:hypothetical protein